MDPSIQTYRPEIDGLRAIAILSVVFFHCGSGVTGGFAGVDIFFVISGYLITVIITKEKAAGTFSFADFYSRRARRILPALFFMAVPVSVIASIVLLPRALDNYGRLLIDTVLFASNFRLARAPGYFDSEAHQNPLLHMWSLSVEEQFYLLWPFLLVLLLASFSRRRLEQAVLAVGLASFAASAVLVSLDPRIAFYHLPSRGWELLAGAAVALNCIPQLPSRRASEALSILGLGLIILSVFWFTEETPFPGFAAIFPVLGCACIIHSESRGRTLVGAILSLKPIVFVGLISYSLYLWHWPLLSLLSYALVRPLTPTEALVCIACAVALAVFSLEIVERPFRRTLSDKSLGLWPFAARVPILGAVAACLLVMGSVLHATEGLSGRFQNIDLGADPPLRLVKCVAGVDPNSLETCVIGDSRSQNEASFVLWGDSHARHYIPALDQMRGVGIAYLRNDCPPLLNVVRSKKSHQKMNQSCALTNAKVIDEIRSTKPALVILASRWLTPNLQYVPVPEYGRPAELEGDKNNRDVRDEAAFAEALRDTIYVLSKGGARVLILAKVPEVQKNVPQCVFMARRFGADPDGCGKVPRRSVLEKQQPVNAIFDAIAAENQNVAVFSPIGGLCDENFCYGVRNGKPLYSDDNHLSQLGAMLLRADLEAFLPQRLKTVTLPSGAITAPGTDR